jgi:hypothetical protein
MPWQDIDEHNFPAVCRDDFMADHLLAGIIAPFHQHAWLDPRDKFQRRILFEDHDEIDRFQRGKHLSTRALILHRPLGSFEPPHRCIAVKTDNQTIACGSRLGHNPDVTRVQDIKASIGEAHP